MKKVVGIIAGVLCMTISMAQNPVSWSYTSKKISNNVYEVHLKASIASGWHLYAQQQPDNFIGVPTSIKFNKHALVALDGKIKEEGKMEKSKEPVLETEAWHYTKEVDFVQKITLKNLSSKGRGGEEGTVKTSVSGSIEFQVCTNEKCLPPATVSFNVVLE